MFLENVLYKIKLNVCFLLKHKIGDSKVHLDGFEQIDTNVLVIHADMLLVPRKCVGKKKNQKEKEKQQEKMGII